MTGFGASCAFLPTAIKHHDHDHSYGPQKLADELVVGIRIYSLGYFGYTCLTAIPIIPSLPHSKQHVGHAPTKGPANLLNDGLLNLNVRETTLRLAQPSDVHGNHPPVRMPGPGDRRSGRMGWGPMRRSDWMVWGWQHWVKGRAPPKEMKGGPPQNRCPVRDVDLEPSHMPLLVLVQRLQDSRNSSISAKQFTK